MSATDMRDKASKAVKSEISRKNAEDVAKKVKDSDHLFNHLEQLITKASNQGKFTIDKQTFAADRFRTNTVDEVVDRLKADGYKVYVTGNNALHQIIFEISW